MAGGGCTGKTSGPNDKKSFGTSDAEAPPDVLPGSPEELAAMAKEAAANEGQGGKATHLLTMAINATADKMPRNKEGVATDADLLAWNKSSQGKLADLLAERSRAYLQQGRTSDAVEDADTCVRSDPSFEAGYIRLVEALAASGRSLQAQLEVCERGLAACLQSESLVSKKWQLKKTISAGRQPDEEAEKEVGSQASAVAETRRLADSPTDPRHAVAAADWGSLLASGAHGVKKDLTQAVKYLQIGSKSGDATAQCNLGLVLLELKQPAEAAEELRRAADAGNAHASDVLQQLLEEARAQQREARAKLEKIAAMGDPRARAMLEEFERAEREGK